MADIENMLPLLKGGPVRFYTNPTPEQLLAIRDPKPQPWELLHMYLCILTSRPRKNRRSNGGAVPALPRLAEITAPSAASGSVSLPPMVPAKPAIAIEYIDETGAKALSSAMEVAMSLAPRSPLAQAILRVLGQLTTIKTDTHKVWLSAKRGTRALLRYYQRIISQSITTQKSIRM